MPIEDLLRWAFRDELPKSPPRGGGEWRSAAPGFAGVGGAWATMPSVDNHWGVVADLHADGPPHPDAVLIGEAVTQLDAWEIDLPIDWNPLSDLGLSEVEQYEVLSRVMIAALMGPARLIRKHAIMGGCPEWEAERPERMMVRRGNGRDAWFRKINLPYTDPFGVVIDRVVEVDGYDARGKRPYKGAYRKTVLEPDPKPAAESRGEYELWRSALDAMCEMLAGALKDHEALPSARPIRPWESGDVPTVRVLPDLKAASTAMRMVENALHDKAVSLRRKRRTASA